MTKGSDNEFPSVLFGELADTPTTPDAGNWRLFTKADGLYLVDDAGSVTGPFVASSDGYTEGARVRNDANIAIANGAWTSVTFNTEDFDTDTIHDTGTNPSRLTCVTAGKYIIVGYLGWGSNTTGLRGVRILFNNTTVIGGNMDGAPSVGESGQNVTAIYALTAGQYVELQAYQTITGGGTLEVVQPFIQFAMQRIG